ncbi:hypothetical protein TNCV_4619561 [Trichonephila clavipes]|nr:hypothetical protein TNCV_4619561 [Trichonephila clavipes]
MEKGGKKLSIDQWEYLYKENFLSFLSSLKNSSDLVVSRTTPKSLPLLKLRQQEDLTCPSPSSVDAGLESTTRQPQVIGHNH